MTMDARILHARSGGTLEQKSEPLRPQKTAGGKLGFPLKPKPAIRLERGT